MVNTLVFVLVLLTITFLLSGGVAGYYFVRAARVVRYNRTGVRFKDWQMWDQSCIWFQKALALEPRHALSHYNLAFVLYFGKNLPDAAKREFEEAIAADSNMAAAHYALGHLLLHVHGNLEAAERHLQTSIRLNPSLSEARNTLGLVEIKRENWQGAMDRFRTAVGMNSSYDIATCNLAIACVYQGKNSDAIRYAEKYVELQPRSPQAHKNLGNIYGATGRRREAIRELKVTLGLAPSEWIVHFWLGCLYLQTNQPRKATVSFHEALGLRPGFALAYYNLALAYESLGQKKFAREYIDHAIELKPDLGEDLI